MKQRSPSILWMVSHGWMVCCYLFGRWWSVAAPVLPGVCLMYCGPKCLSQPLTANILFCCSSSSFCDVKPSSLLSALVLLPFFILWLFGCYFFNFFPTCVQCLFHRKARDSLPSFRQFFSSAFSLTHVSLASMKVPPDSLRWVTAAGFRPPPSCKSFCRDPSPH